MWNDSVIVLIYTFHPWYWRPVAIRWPAAALPDTNTVQEPVVLTRRDRIPQSSQSSAAHSLLPQTSSRRPVTPFNKIFRVIVRCASLVRRAIRLLQKANRHQWRRDAREKLGYRSERIWDVDNEGVIVWGFFFNSAAVIVWTWTTTLTMKVVRLVGVHLRYNWLTTKCYGPQSWQSKIWNTHRNIILDEYL